MNEDFNPSLIKWYFERISGNKRSNCEWHAIPITSRDRRISWYVYGSDYYSDKERLCRPMRALWGKSERVECTARFIKITSSYSASKKLPTEKLISWYCEQCLWNVSAFVRSRKVYRREWYSAIGSEKPCFICPFSGIKVYAYTERTLNHRIQSIPDGSSPFTPLFFITVYVR